MTTPSAGDWTDMDTNGTEQRASSCMLNERRRRVAIGAVLVLIGGLAFSTTGSIQGVGGTTYGMDSSFTPRILTALLMFFGLIIALSKPPLRSDEEEDEASPSSDWRRVILSVLAIAFYVSFLAPLGFVVASALYIVIQALILAPPGRSWKVWAILIALVFPIPIYIAFVRGLSLLLPVGIFG